MEKVILRTKSSKPIEIWDDAQVITEIEGEHVISYEDQKEIIDFAHAEICDLISKLMKKGADPTTLILSIELSNIAPRLESEFRRNPSKRAEFIIDDNKVSVQHKLIEGILTKMIYINGLQRASWSIDEHSNESKRFSVSHAFHLTSKEEREEIRQAGIMMYSRTFFTTLCWSKIIKQWCDRDINKSICLVDDEGNTIYKYK